MTCELKIIDNLKAKRRPLIKNPAEAGFFIVVQRDGRLTTGLLDQYITTLDLGVSESDQLATDIDHQGT